VSRCCVQQVMPCCSVQANKARIFVSWIDSPLTERGRKEASLAGEALSAAGLRSDIVFTRYVSTASRHSRAPSAVGFHIMAAVLEVKDLACAWCWQHAGSRRDHRALACRGQRAGPAARDTAHVADERALRWLPGANPPRRSRIAPRMRLLATCPPRARSCSQYASSRTVGPCSAAPMSG